MQCRDPEAASVFTTLLRGYYGDVMLKGAGPPAAGEIRAWVQAMLKVFLGGRRDW